ncbi:MAG: MFS transporter [Planctomycetota bacterium]
MAATLPGRTFGISLITTRLLEDFNGLTETRFAWINFIAAIIGGAACLPAGLLLDRFGVRRVLAVVMLALAGSVYLMTLSTSIAQLAITLTLTRAIGQSMLSVISLAMLGKWFGRGAGLSMGAYAVVMTMLLATGVGLLGLQVSMTDDWRAAWSGLAWVLLGLVPVALITALRPRARTKTHQDGTAWHHKGGATLGQALSTRCFWVFALAMGLFALASSGATLFLQPILAERGISEQVYQATLIVGLSTGLVANLVGGGLIKRVPMNRLLAIAMLLLALALIGLALLDRPALAYAQAAVMGLSGGLITVLFFAVWVRAFGTQSLGKIQGCAQLISVIGSALGPLVIAKGRETTDSHHPALITLAVATALISILAAATTVPRREWFK